MSTEEGMAALRVAFPTGNVEEQLTPEARERLQQIAKQTAALNCEVFQITESEAARLAETPDGQETLANAIKNYYGLLSLEGTLMSAPNVEVNPEFVQTALGSAAEEDGTSGNDSVLM